MSSTSPSTSSSSVSTARWLELKRASRDRAAARRARDARIAASPVIATYTKPGSDGDTAA